MRLNNLNKQFKPGNVRGRSQWMFLGVVMGAIAALALNSETGWIVRKQMTTGLPVARSLDNPVVRIEFGGWGTVSPDVVSAADNVTRSARNDVALQIAGALFRNVANASESKHIHDAYDHSVIIDQSAIDAELKPTREGALYNVHRSYPSSPIADAAYICELVSSDIKSNRPESDWINGQGKEKSAASDAPPGAAMLRGLSPADKAEETRRLREKEAANDAKDAILTQKRMQAIEEASRSGVQCDPQNAFFPMMLAYVHYFEHKDAEALQDIEDAAHASVYNDFSFERAGGWQRLDMAMCGTPDSTIEEDRLRTGVDHRCTSALLDVGEITIWKAIELEHSGRISDGVALRMRIAGIGAAISRIRSRGYSYSMGPSLMMISASGFGGVYIPKDTTLKEEPYVRRYRNNTAYTHFLERHGFALEAAWCKPIFKAEYKQSGRQSIAASEYNFETANQGFLAQHLQNPVIFQIFGYWILAQATLIVITGLALGLIGFYRRFTPQKEVRWSRVQWGSALAGCLIATFCLIGCSILYTGANAWPLIGFVLCIVGAVQMVLRRSPYADTPIPLLMNSVCFTACLFIAAGISAFRIDSMLDWMQTQSTQVDPSILASVIPFGVGLLVVPALAVFGLIAALRVRYQGVPSGLFYGSRRIIVPMISALLILWAVDLVVTAGVQKDARMVLIKDLGLKSDVSLR